MELFCDCFRLRIVYRVCVCVARRIARNTLRGVTTQRSVSIMIFRKDSGLSRDWDENVKFPPKTLVGRELIYYETAVTNVTLALCVLC